MTTARENTPSIWHQQQTSARHGGTQRCTALLRLRTQRIAASVSALLLVCLLYHFSTELSGSASAQQLRRPNLSANPGWEAFRNRLLPSDDRLTRQDFGFSTSNHAGGGRAGEIGGWVQRSLTSARYTRRLSRELSFDDALQASGKLAVIHNDGASGALVGWRHTSSRGWRTPNSLAFRIDGNGDTFWLFYEYGTQSGRTGGGGAFEGERYQTTPTKPFPADGKPHDWRLVYDPEAGKGHGLVTFAIDDRVYRLPLREEDRADGALFDQFGIWNQEATGGRVEFWIDDLVVNGQAIDLDRDPNWNGHSNRATYAEDIVRPYHNFGFSRPTPDEPNRRGVGGVIWRDEQPCYYADRVGRLSLDQPPAGSVIAMAPQTGGPSPPKGARKRVFCSLVPAAATADPPRAAVGMRR